MARKTKEEKRVEKIVSTIFIIILLIISIYKNYKDTISNNVIEDYANAENTFSYTNNIDSNLTNDSTSSIDLNSIPEYTSSPYIEINNNIPYFTDEELSVTESYETYKDLDALGRCQGAMALIGKDLMPTEPRGDISQIKPSGWKQARYDIVEGKSLYNRCHLIGYQLTAENANEKNLITGTRYLNVEGMLPFENKVCEYIKENSSKHVLYRVTPIFEGDNLVASGVLMEAESSEDRGENILFCVYCYNVQPGITIDYKTGASKLS